MFLVLGCPTVELLLNPPPLKVLFDFLRFFLVPRWKVLKSLLTSMKGKQPNEQSMSIPTTVAQILKSFMMVA